MLSSVAAQSQESGRFALAGPIPRKKTPVEGLYWTRAGGQRVSYRPLGGVQAPAARASGSRISQAGGGRFWGQWRIRTRTGKIRQPGFRNSPVVSCIRWGLRNTKIDRPNGRSPISDLIHRPWRTAAAAGSSTRSIRRQTLPFVSIPHRIRPFETMSAVERYLRIWP